MSFICVRKISWKSEENTLLSRYTVTYCNSRGENPDILLGFSVISHYVSLCNSGCKVGVWLNCDVTLLHLCGDSWQVDVVYYTEKTIHPKSNTSRSPVRHIASILSPLPPLSVY